MPAQDRSVGNEQWLAGDKRVLWRHKVTEMNARTAPAGVGPVGKSRYK